MAYTLIHLYLPTKKVPESFEYSLRPLGRTPDDEIEVLHRPDTIFEWRKVTEVEMDRFIMLTKMHDIAIVLGAPNNQYPNAVSMKLDQKSFDHFAEHFFDITKRMD